MTAGVRKKLRSAAEKSRTQDHPRRKGVEIEVCLFAQYVLRQRESFTREMHYTVNHKCLWILWRPGLLFRASVRTSCESMLLCLSKAPMSLVILLIAALVKATMKDVANTSPVASRDACLCRHNGNLRTSQRPAQSPERGLFMQAQPSYTLRKSQRPASRLERYLFFEETIMIWAKHFVLHH